MVTHLKDKFNAVSREGKVGKGDAGIVDDDADGLGAGQQGIGTGAHAGEVGQVARLVREAGVWMSGTQLGERGFGTATGSAQNDDFLLSSLVCDLTRIS